MTRRTLRRPAVTGWPRLTRGRYRRLHRSRRCRRCRRHRRLAPPFFSAPRWPPCRPLPPPCAVSPGVAASVWPVVVDVEVSCRDETSVATLSSLRFCGIDVKKTAGWSDPVSTTTTAACSSVHVAPWAAAFVYDTSYVTSQPACPLTWSG